MNLEIAMRLIELRKKNGFSQEELADKLNVSRQAVSKWERVETSPSTDNLIALAKLYNISLDELLLISDNGASEREKSENYTREDEENINGSACNSDTESRNNNGGCGRGDFINFTDEDGSCVRIGKGGIHVKDKNKGDEVHVGWDGIHIIEGGKSHINMDSNNAHNFKAEKKPSPYEIAVDSLATIIVVVGYILLGVLGNLWHPGWLILLAQPILASIFIPKRIEGVFPVCVVVTYLALGFFGGWWHPGWVIFFAIPIFYSIWNLIKTAVLKSKNKTAQN